MEYTDIKGVPLRQGDHVAFARTRGGTLATGYVVSFVFDRGLLTHLRVRLATNGRETNVPYFRDKFVILARATPVVAPLATRALGAARALTAQGLPSFDAGMVRGHLGIPWSESHSVHMALEDLHEAGEIRPAPYPPHAFVLTELGKE